MLLFRGFAKILYIMYPWSCYSSFSRSEVRFLEKYPFHVKKAVLFHFPLLSFEVQTKKNVNMDKKER